MVFVTGEAGQGKSSLLQAFSRRSQATLPDLIVAMGICDVYTGVGDPFLPFRDVLGMLTGDVESQWRSGNISRDHALRLWHLFPQAVEALTTVGQGLIDTLLPGSAMLSRAATFAVDEEEWLKRLREQIRRGEISGGGPAPEQERLFEAYTAVLSALATRQPLLIILDDLHWADLSSISLLAHLGRRLADSPILIIGAYRPEDVDQGRDGQSHPLTSVLSEFKRLLGNIWLDLDQGAVDEALGFVDALLDAEPNRLTEDFRQAFATHTSGQALFAIELLRDLQERGDLRQDEAGV